MSAPGLIAKFQVVMSNLWDRSRALHSIWVCAGASAPAWEWERWAQEGATASQATLFLSDREKGERSQGLTLECPEPLCQEKD